MEIGIAAFWEELNETLKRQAALMNELMYRKWISEPLANRIINVLDDAPLGAGVHGGTPESGLLSRDLAYWDLNISEDYIRKMPRRNHA